MSPYSAERSANAENLTVFAMNPTDYLNNPQQFVADLNCAGYNGLAVTLGTTCSGTPAGNGSFSQNVQRLGLYAQDSWRHARAHRYLRASLRHHVRLVHGSGQSQLENPAYSQLHRPGVSSSFRSLGAPHDYRKQFGPRIGIATPFGKDKQTVIRSGFGMFYNDLAQNGWRHRSASGQQR